MNIFIVDTDPVVAAQSLHDRHVVKMCIETAQLLCTVAHQHGLAAIRLRFERGWLKHFWT